MFNLIYEIRQKDVKLLLNAIYKDNNRDDFYLLCIVNNCICISTENKKTCIKMIEIIEKYKNKKIKTNEVTKR